MTIGYYRDPRGRTCAIRRPRNLTELERLYMAECQEDEIVETRTLTPAQALEERIAQYRAAHTQATYEQAYRVVLAGDPALAAAYSDRPVPVRAGPARAHTHADTAEGIKEQLRQLIKDRVETTPQEVLLGLLSDQSWREQIMPLLLELIQ